MNIKAIMEYNGGGFYLCDKEEIGLYNGKYEDRLDSDNFIGYIDIDDVDDFVGLYENGYGVFDIKGLMNDWCDKEFQVKVFNNIHSYLTLELSTVESELAKL